MSIESPLKKIMLSGGKADGPMLGEIVGGAYVSSLRTMRSMTLPQLKKEKLNGVQHLTAIKTAIAEKKSGEN